MNAFIASLLASVLTLVPAAARAEPPTRHELWLPGGVAALAEATGIPEPVERTSLWIDLTRRAHGSEVDEGNTTVLQQLRAYVEIVDGLERAIRESGWPAAGLSLAEARQTLGSARVTSVLAALGLSPDGDPRAGERRRVLATAGVDVAKIDARLNAGEVVQLAIRREAVPSPLSSEQWRRLIAGEAGRQEPAELTFGQLLTDRRAALLGHGLLAVDGETLTALAGDGETLSALYHRRSGAFAAFGRALRIRSGLVDPPGGQDTVGFWTELVGAPPTDAGAFVRRLFEVDGGRLVFFYDAMGMLDAPHLAFALGPPGSSTEGRLRQGRSLYRSFATIDPEWDLQALPFSRPTMSPPVWLLEVAVAPDGQPQLPRSRRFWEAVFAPGVPMQGARAVPPLEEPDGVDAAWLTDRIMASDPTLRRERFYQVMLAQRLFPRPQPSQARDVLIALRGAGAMPALVLTMERMGVKDPALFAEAVPYAERLNGIGDPIRARDAIGQFQAAVALIERGWRSRVFTAADSAEVLRSLFAVPLPDSGRYDGAIARWLADRLLPRMASALDLADSVDAEEIVLASFAGRPHTGSAPAVVEWEGETFQVNLAERELTRLRRVRERQGGPTLGTVLAFTRAATDLAAGSTSLDAVHAAVSTIEKAASAVAVTTDRQTIGRLADDEAVARALKALKAIGKVSDVEKAARHARPLVAIGDSLLVRVLRSLVYAGGFADPDGIALLADDVSMRHDYALVDRDEVTRRRIPWSMPVEGSGTGPWHVRGALMALDLALARFALRRLSDDVPPQPTLNGNDRRAFAEVAVMLDPRTLTDADLAAIAGAIDRGRERVKTIADNGGAGEAVAAAAGLSGWRLQAFEWRRAHEPDRVLPLFSLGDLLRLGDPDPALVARLDLWGTSAVSATGCLCLRFPPRVGTDAYEGRQDAGLWAGFTPDVTLRVVELMHRLKLPAALLPGVLQSVLQSYVESAATAYHGDWMRMIAQAQALTEERLADHVAALTAVGALVAR